MYFRFLARELRRRSRSATVVAIGLALGVGLVVTVTAAAAGVKAAQGEVLHSLYGVGTDITVTEPATPGSGGGFHFGGSPTSRAQAGTPFSSDHLSSSSGLTTFSSTTLTSISKQKGVSRAAGALTLTSIHVTGTFPSFSGGGGGSGAAPSVAPFSVNTYTIDGIQVSSPGLGPLSSSKLTSGSYFTGAQSDKAVALVDASFAKEKGLKVGSSWTIASTTFKVIGIVTPSATSSGADVYVPLKEAQTVAGDTGKINTVYVSAASASDIGTVQTEIQHLVPKATVTTAQDLADQVSGSLTNAATLTNSLGTWLAAAVLLAAFVLAALLTLASVSRRGRDFGTLKALGWHSRRIVGQVIGESVVQGLVGGVVGLALGLGGAELVSKLAPKLYATVGGATNVGTGPGAGFGGGGRAFTGGGAGFAHHAGGAIDPTKTVPVHLTAPIQPEVLLLAVGLAVAGGLIAGILGGWRVSRLRPAEALRRVE